MYQVHDLTLLSAQPIHGNIGKLSKAIGLTAKNPMEKPDVQTSSEPYAKLVFHLEHPRTQPTILLGIVIRHPAFQPPDPQILPVTLS
jgi:hypothetical protein